MVVWVDTVVDTADTVDIHTRTPHMVSTTKDIVFNKYENQFHERVPHNLLGYGNPGYGYGYYSSYPYSRGYGGYYGGYY